LTAALEPRVSIDMVTELMHFLAVVCLSLDGLQSVCINLSTGQFWAHQLTICICATDNMMQP
jgi:hypothetical protein